MSELKLSGWLGDHKLPDDVTRHITQLCMRVQSKDKRIAELEKIAEAVAHIGVDFGYGEYVLEDSFIESAREIIGTKDKK